jgi:hypothetical protein
MAEPRSIEKRNLRSSLRCPLGGELARNAGTLSRSAQHRQDGSLDPTQGPLTGSIDQENEQACSRNHRKHHGKDYESGDHLLHVIELQRRNHRETNPHPLPNLLLWNRPRGKHWESFRA